MLNYKTEELKRRIENTKQLRESIAKNKLDKSLEEKINNFCLRHELEFDLIKHKLLNDDLFLLHFVKDPAKQSIHQGLASDFIKKIANLSNFKVLPSGGKNALYVINGMVIDEKTFQGSSSDEKSIDFYWTYTNSIGENVECYASHKYTSDGGGGQDNQYKDITSFLSNAKCHTGNLFFYAICDGNYYQKFQVGQNLSRIDFLNSSFYGPRCRALNINDLENHMLNNL